ncbi:GNAT family N-acetyltransferase [Leisingera sp. ANG-Vp]|uniref:GNAT family N-acetyltransferase n=1 Tax=Leisingera sp. ANG-Vp TaxID=1577896 RepID=UPI0005802B8F|nr:GNAT family N-acetyltransferase [Leisingera sp. ANG-Vp]KIC16255.1 hypothetical protein RA20_16870 [Leisingera sp. ANG-Vp]
MNNCAAIRGAPKAALEVQVLTSWADLAAREADWRAMHDNCRGRLYSSFDWLAAQQAGFGPPEALRIVTIWQGRDMVAAAPMCLIRKRFSKLLPLYRPRVLSGWVCSYTGFFEFLATSRDTLRALLEAVCREAPRGGIELPTFRLCTRDAFTTRCLRLGGLDLWQDRAQGASIAENLCDWDSYCQSRSRSFRKKVRVSSRELQRAGAEVEAFLSEAEEPVQRMLALSGRSWKQRTGTGIAALHGGDVFLADLWRRFAGRDNGSLVLIRAENADIASFCAVRCKDTWYSVFSEFDEAYAGMAPGRASLYQGLQQLIARGQPARVEFGRRTHFLKDFETGSFQVRRVRGVPRGSGAYWLLKLEDELRELTGLRGMLPQKKLRRADVTHHGGGEA